jgi:drug/metabolite transporter (DMT)-like permease
LKRPWGSYALLLGGMSLVGVYVALTKPLTLVFPVFVLALLRFSLAAIMMIPWTFGPRPTANELKWLSLQSFFGNFLFSICMLYGVSLSSASAAGLIMSILPAMVALFSFAILRERLTAQTMMAIGVSVLGIAILQWSAPASSTVNGLPVNTGSALFGNVLLFGAVCCEAVYVVTGKRLSASLSPKRNSALLNLFGLFFTLPFGIWAMPQFNLASVSLGNWLLLLFYAFAASVLSTIMWLTGLSKVPASQAGVFSIALPIAAMLMGVAFLNEQLTIFHAIALACSVIALWLIGSQKNAPANDQAKVK